ncbi:family transcriptional regulator [Micractinium conductrix]|uniref:Family transcriptional regulator n=1 Tax=Micractinium conductrix TaxID=554055 RepID=A0A2P6VGD2_9CHLO|nr:family transcriptional regulator [Micractinium conductrix]|eukprot:PSC73145.1 family transcriptional regulator [Micractinium conductrix]
MEQQQQQQQLQQQQQQQQQEQLGADEGEQQRPSGSDQQQPAESVDAWLEHALCHHDSWKECHVLDGEVVCCATQKLITDEHAELLPDGTLRLAAGKRSCYELRRRMPAWPAGLCLVAYSSIKTIDTTVSVPLLLDALKRTANPFLEPFRARLRSTEGLPAPTSLPAGVATQLVPPARPAYAAGAAFAADAAAALAGAAAAVPQEPVNNGPPMGVEWRNGKPIVRCDAPTLEALTWAAKGNGRGGKLPDQLSVARGGNGSFAAPWLDLWKELRSAGGAHLVLATDKLRAVLEKLGWVSPSNTVVRAAKEAVTNWVLPVYGWSYLEELLNIPSDEAFADLVKEATESGLFLEQGGSVKLAAHCLGASPSRGLLLLAMHACTIKLTPVFDTVSGPGQSRVPVQQFWAHISSAGGPEKVRGDGGAADNVAAACGWQGPATQLRNAVRSAAAQLAVLWPAGSEAASQLEQPEAHQQLAQQQAEARMVPAEQQQAALPDELLAGIMSQLPPDFFAAVPDPTCMPLDWQAMQLQQFAGLPGASLAALTPLPLPTTTTPFNTVGAANVIAQLQLPPMPLPMSIDGVAELPAVAQAVVQHPRKRGRE